MTRKASRFAEEIAKPVIAAVGPIHDRTFETVGEGLYGTAFPIGGARFITANHVTKAIAATAGAIHLGWPRPEQRLIAETPIPISRAVLIQEWPDVDLAALEVPSVDYGAGVWEAGQVPNVLYRVSAVGFPFGYDAATRSLTIRGFSGTIVSARNYDLGRRGTTTCVYELSFATPRGFSGAALFAEELVIVGCIVGNLTTRIKVFADEERLDEAGAVTRVERYEALHLGIAIRSDVILELSFRDGQTVREWVAAHRGTIRSP